LAKLYTGYGKQNNAINIKNPIGINIINPNNANRNLKNIPIPNIAIINASRIINCIKPLH
jgi:hypothetical protein